MLIIKIITCIVLLITCFLHRKIIPDKKENKPTIIQLLVYYGMVVASTVIISINEKIILDLSNNDKYHSTYFFASMILYLVFAGFCMYQGFIISRTREQAERLRAYEEFSVMQKKHVENLIYQDREFRKFRHDMNNHIQTILALSRECDNVELKNYCEKYTDKGAELSLDKFCGDSAIDAILSNIKRQADEKNIRIEYDINYINSGRIETFDLCIILMNTLQNSLEANDKIVSDRFIKLKMAEISGVITIIVENPIDVGTFTSDGFPRTTKDDNQNHGFGLQNVRDTVDKYDGSFKYSVNNDVFKISISILKTE